MKVSIQTINYINEVYNCSDKISDIDEVVRRIGAQLGAVEDVEYWGSRYDGVVVAKVVSCEKHPNADKLSVCKIDDGGHTKNIERDQDDNVQVVCGAPNVRAGLTVAWIPPGATVPSTLGKDPFILEAREIRGVVSNGMLASPAELGISDNHDGILEIDEAEVGKELAIPGSAFKNLYRLDDVIIDCENKMFTHRPDCFGILGVARELAGIQGLKYTSPDWYLDSSRSSVGSNQLPLEVRVEDNKIVPRFMAVVMSDVRVRPSPIWLQAFLCRVGIKSINNVVDITNYYSQLTGQPTHAYDYDKVAKLSGGAPTLIARQAKKGDSIALLNSKTVEFDAPTVVIATDKQAIGVGGVMGGSETEVDDNTKNIIIECANFDMYNIRRTSMKYGLFTDAVTRFTKGQSIYQNDKVLTKIMQDISRECNGTQASDVIDIHDELPQTQNIKVSREFINDRLGSELKSVDMQRLLENVEIKVTVDNDELTITPPFWRTDLMIAEDIVEEVGRLHGFDKLPVSLPSRDSAPAAVNQTIKIKQELREILSATGANELLTYSFIHGDLMKKVGQEPEHAFKLSNAISPDLQYYRMSLLPSLLDKVHANVKSGHEEFALFEINKVHAKDFIGKDELPAEDNRLAFVFVVDDKKSKSDYQGSPYYYAQRYLCHILDRLGINPEFESAIEHSPNMEISKVAFAPFEPKRSAIVKDTNGNFIGEIGELRNAVKRNLKLPAFIAAFELDVQQLLKLQSSTQYLPLSKFPSISQDITLKTPETVSYAKLREEVSKVLSHAKQEHGYETMLIPLDIYKSTDSLERNITFKITLTHHERTLVTDETNTLLDTIVDSVAHIGVTRV